MSMLLEYAGSGKLVGWAGRLVGEDQEGLSIFLIFKWGNGKKNY